MSAVEVELHRKLGVEPYPPSVELEQIRSDEPVDLLDILHTLLGIDDVSEDAIGASPFYACLS